MPNKSETRSLLLISHDPNPILREVANLPGTVWSAACPSDELEVGNRLRSSAAADIVFLDLANGDATALHAIRWLREARPEVPVVLLSSDAGSDTAELGRRWGAREQLTKPLQRAQVTAVLDRHLPKPELEGEFEDIEEVGDNLFFVAASPVMQRLRAQIEWLAKLHVPVLILGERGSGKETIAKLLHKRSIRSECKFLKVNCAALPGDLLESELFGYAPAGSLTSWTGRGSQLQLCSNGTLLLDEVAELPRSLQLRVLNLLGHNDRGEAGKTGYSDVRILATMAADVRHALAGKLDAGVFYRLSTFTLRVPPLRERAQEIPLLLGYFMNRTARQYELPARVLSPAVIDQCRRYAWPGNVRELESFVKKYLLTGDASISGETSMAETGLQAHADVPLPATPDRSDVLSRSMESQNLVRNARRQAEKDVIINALENTRWNRRAAARFLNISYRGLLYKIEEHQLARPDYSIYAPAPAQRRKKRVSDEDSSSQSPLATGTGQGNPIGS